MNRPDTRKSLTRKAIGYGVAAIVLLGVYKLYTQPDFLVMMANQIWACF